MLFLSGAVPVMWHLAVGTSKKMVCSSVKMITGRSMAKHVRIAERWEIVLQGKVKTIKKEFYFCSFLFIYFFTNVIQSQYSSTAIYSIGKPCIHFSLPVGCRSSLARSWWLETTSSTRNALSVHPARHILGMASPMPLLRDQNCTGMFVFSFSSSFLSD